MDETTLTLHPPLRRCWMKRGERKAVPGAGTPQALHVFGAYNWRSGRVTHQTAAHKNSETFITFVERLLTVYPRQRLILVMDNASYHRSQASQAALSLYEDRVLVIWLPKYSPYLNPIERFWLWLKNRVNANYLHRSLTDLTTALERTMNLQNLWQPERLQFLG